MVVLLRKLALHSVKKKSPLWTLRYLSQNQKLDIEQEDYSIIYNKPQHRTIRAILGVSIVNLYVSKRFFLDFRPNNMSLRLGRRFYLTILPMGA